jgi:hypothetical protein
MKLPPDRNGVALFVALVAMTLVVAIVAGAWMIALREFRAARAGVRAEGALDAAEAAANDAMSTWTPSLALSLRDGDVSGPLAATYTGGATSSARLVRLSRTLFLSLGDGQRGIPPRTLAHRAVALLLRLVRPDAGGPAALTARDSVEVRIGATVDGGDVAPPGWPAGPGCPLATGAAGVESPDTTRVCDGSCMGSPAGGIAGSPVLQLNPVAADTLRYAQYGDESWASLTARANVTLLAGATIAPSPVVAGAACDRAVASNWGDPSGGTPCAGYFPIIWARGDLHLAGGAGQGILLVDGDVELRGGFDFAGIIVARDDVTSGGGGAQVFGTVLAGDRSPAAGDHTVLDSGVHLQYSSCAIDRATMASSRLVRVRERHWFPTY